MADDAQNQEKTEEATPRRREEAREKGQVALSTELVSALSLLASLGVVLLLGAAASQNVGGLVRQNMLDLGAVGTIELDEAITAQLVGAAGRSMLESLALLALPLLVVALLAAYSQVGFRIAPKALAPDPSRLNPIKGLTRLFSARTTVRVALAILKISIITTVVAAMAWSALPEAASTVAVDLGPAMVATGHVVMRATFGALIAVLAIALFDFGFQRWQHGRDLRMTKQEVREENKMTDGDPHVRARVRQIQREVASRRMMAEVPKATVVVTNPTHYAVALRYGREDEGDQRAPHVVAKGVDHVAQRIKQVAAEAGVVTFEDVPLARALHAQVEIGEEIPEGLYEAVASVLAYVYRVRGEVAAAGEVATR